MNFKGAFLRLFTLKRHIGDPARGRLGVPGWRKASSAAGGSTAWGDFLGSNWMGVGLATSVSVCSTGFEKSSSIWYSSLLKKNIHRCLQIISRLSCC